MNKIKCLLKFGERKYLKRFQEGKMYFSNAVTFRYIEDELFIKGQGDRLEGGSMLTVKSVKITNQETGEVINIPTQISIPIHYEPANKLPVFCLFACFEKDCSNTDGDEFQINLQEDIKKDIINHFPKADSVAIIRKPYEFIKDVHKSIGDECKSDLVKYFHLYGYSTDNGKSNDLDYLKYLSQDTPTVNTGNFAKTSFKEKNVFRALLCKDIYFIKEQEYRFILPEVNIDEPKEFDVRIRNDIELVDIDSIL